MTAAPEHVRVDHRGCHILVSHQLLYSPDVITSLEQMSGKGMPESVATPCFRNASRTHRPLDRLLQHAIRKVMAADHTGERITAALVRREHILPAPLPFSLRVLPRQGVR